MKKLYLTILVLATVLSAYSQSDFEVAKSFMAKKGVTLVDNGSTTRATSEPYSIFNGEDEKGFAIVMNGNVVGYSTENAANADNLPPQLKDLLSSYSKNPQMAKTRGNVANPKNATPIEPLIKTQWGQQWPYYLMCPEIEGQKCVTGCEATAMAQILYYYNWPNEVSGFPEYVASVFGVGDFEGRGLKIDSLPPTTFKWDKMKFKYSGDESEDSTNAVAELMRYCGQAVHTCYGRNQSATTIVGVVTFGIGFNTISEILRDVFNYSPNILYNSRDVFPTSVWEDMIYEELLEGRPILYSGTDPNRDCGTHAFICDGYDGDGLFHMNWGWNGLSNGYYSLSLLGDYNNHQNALTCIRPIRDGEVSMRYEGYGIAVEPSYDVSGMSKACLRRDSTTSEFPKPKITRYFYNTSNDEYNGELGLALFQNGYEEENIKYVLAVDTISVRPNGVFKTIDRVLIPSDIPIGDYVMSLVKRHDKTDRWTIPSPAFYDFIVSADSINILSFWFVNSWDPQMIIHNVEIEGDMIVGNPIKLNISYSNIGRQTEIQTYLMEDGNQLKLYYFHSEPIPTQINQDVITYTPTTEGVKEIQIASPQAGGIMKDQQGQWIDYIRPRNIYYSTSFTILPSSSKIEQISKSHSGTSIAAYTLQGVKLQIDSNDIKNLSKGIYIINGQKVVIK